MNGNKIIGKSNLNIVYKKGDDYIGTVITIDEEGMIEIKNDCLFIIESGDKLLAVIPLANLVIFEVKKVG